MNDRVRLSLLGVGRRTFGRHSFPIAIAEMGARCLLLMAGSTLNAKKILIVEDNFAIAESISRSIGEVGFAAAVLMLG